MNKATLFIFGSLLAILGLSLVLREWAAVTILFKGVMGMALAVAGLVMLFMATIKK